MEESKVVHLQESWEIKSNQGFTSPNIKASQ